MASRKLSSTEQKMLETQLNEVKEEKNKQTEAVLHAKEDILSNFAELMETELQCSICNELFVQVCIYLKQITKDQKKIKLPFITCSWWQ
jgi:hypothetical protein